MIFAIFISWFHQWEDDVNLCLSNRLQDFSLKSPKNYFN